jgi:hypothetical protein
MATDILVARRYNRALIDAYTSDGWRSGAAETVKPTAAVEAAEAKVARVRLALGAALREIEGLDAAAPRAVADAAGDVDVDAFVCGACGGREADDENDLLLCDMEDCGRCVHQACCVPPLASADIPEDFFCDACRCRLEALELLNDEFGTDAETASGIFPELREGGDGSGGGGGGDDDDMSSDDSEFNPHTASAERGGGGDGGSVDQGEGGTGDSASGSEAGGGSGSERAGSGDEGGDAGTESDARSTCSSSDGGSSSSSSSVGGAGGGDGGRARAVSLKRKRPASPSVPPPPAAKSPRRGRLAVAAVAAGSGRRGSSPAASASRVSPRAAAARLPRAHDSGGGGGGSSAARRRSPAPRRPRRARAPVDYVLLNFALFGSDVDSDASGDAPPLGGAAAARRGKDWKPTGKA